MRIAIFDDYQDVARRFADWHSLNAEVEVFREPFGGTETLVARLAEFDVPAAMRERTPFPADLLRRPGRLKRHSVCSGSAGSAGRRSRSAC